jgi:DNA-binding NtrC family response regulator
VGSEQDKGTVFSVFIPAFFTEARQNADEITAPDTALAGKGERILLVEDDNEVREMSAEILRRNGYCVFTAKSAKRAWDIFQRENGRIDLVFCDMVLPDMPGTRLVEEMSEGHEGLKVIFCSGYDHLQPAGQETGVSSRPFLRKPYSFATLLRTVKSSLEK